MKPTRTQLKFLKEVSSECVEGFAKTLTNQGNKKEIVYLFINGESQHFNRTYTANKCLNNGWICLIVNTHNLRLIVQLTDQGKQLLGE